MTTQQAIQVFGKGFTFTRSFTHRYLFEPVESLWVMRDAPRKNPINYRSEEFLVAGVAAEEADAIVRRHRRGRFAVCAFRELDQDPNRFKDGFKQLGYRLRTTEQLFVHDLTDLPEIGCPYKITRVNDQAQADRLAQAAGSRQILPHHLGQANPGIRQYMAMDGDEPVGWVRSIHAGTSAWCSNMFVRADYRRQGIARALMTRMLAEDREHGLSYNVLLASHTGALLYPTLGYRLTGELFAFSPGPAWDRA